MNPIITLSEVERKIIKVRDKNVILDADVADLYGVTTKQVNQAVRRNPEKFPVGYVIALTNQERNEVVTICDHLDNLKFSKNLPYAFTESGLYMLATILKSSKATATTILIIDTFLRLREIGKTINTLSTQELNEKNKELLVRRAGELISDLVVPSSLETEASIELNFAVVKFRYNIKKKSKKKVSC